MGFDLEPGWLWMIGGVLLLIAEMLAPGFFLLFVGAAAILTGAFALIFDLATAGQLALFAIYTAVALMVGRRFYARPPLEHGGGQVNDPMAQLVGRTVMVVAAVDDHGGRVRVGDGEWNARGDPAAPGERVRIVGVDGNCLKVERAR